jgi:hypothetical protein
VIRTTADTSPYARVRTPARTRSTAAREGQLQRGFPMEREGSAISTNARYEDWTDPASSALFQEIVESSDDAIITCDQAAKVVTWGALPNGCSVGRPTKSWVGPFVTSSPVTLAMRCDP